MALFWRTVPMASANIQVRTRMEPEVLCERGHRIRASLRTARLEFHFVPLSQTQAVEAVVRHSGTAGKVTVNKSVAGTDKRFPVRPGVEK